MPSAGASVSESSLPELAPRMAKKGKEKAKEEEQRSSSEIYSDRSLDENYARDQEEKKSRNSPKTPPPKNTMTAYERQLYQEKLDEIRGNQSSTSESNIDAEKRRLDKLNNTFSALHIAEGASVGEQRVKEIEELAAQEAARLQAEEKEMKEAKRKQEEEQDARRRSAEGKGQEDRKKLRKGALDVIGKGTKRGGAS
ncbi:hypothetical protein ACMFMG_002734 [Clarireedia jacksonii]